MELAEAGQLVAIGVLEVQHDFAEHAALVKRPFGARCLYTLPCVVVAMAVGYFDDKRGGFSEYQLAAFDLVIALTAAMVICGMSTTNIWLPGFKAVIPLSPWLAVPLASV